MNTLIKKFGNGLIVFAMAAMGGMSAHADDTEIFFNSSYNDNNKPNVLFVLDNSGSMTDKDGGSTSRMARLKSAMDSLLTNLNNLNVGLMQFTIPGGAVLYPVTNIDAPLEKPQTLSLSLASGADDAEQTTGSNTVTLNSKTLAIGSRSSGPGGETTTAISANNDDATENASGTINRTSSDLTLDASGNGAGLIFRNMAIPKNARILSASLDFTIRSTPGSSRNVPLNLVVSAQEPAATINDFISSNISSRTPLAQQVSWSITDPSPQTDEILSSPDLAKVIQAVVDHANWASNGSIALFLQKPLGDSTTGQRIAYSRDGSPSKQPRLNVIWETPITPVTQGVGLRFTNVGIPQGARILSAALEFEAAAESTNTALIEIIGEKADDSAPFTAANDDLGSRTNTTTQLTWTPGNWVANGTYSTADDNVALKDIIQEITDQAGWCGGNALSLFLGNSNERLVKSYETSPNRAPKLRVTYDPATIPAGGGCMATTVSYRVDNSTNDAWGYTSGSSDDTTNSSTLPLGAFTYNGSTYSTYTGFRFSNVQLPKNADVTSAYLEFTSLRNDTSAANYTISVQSAANASQYCSGRSCTEMRDRGRHGTTVAWNSVPAFTANVTYQSPDVTDLVEAVTSHNDWTAGNAISFLFRGTGQRLVMAQDHTSGATGAARLVVRYKAKEKVSGQTTRDVLKSLVNDMQAKTNTPIVDSLYEAARYYRGEALQWGTRRRHSGYYDSDWSNSIFYPLRVSHPDSYTGGTPYKPAGCTDANPNSSNCINERIDGSPKYISPIKSECQTNHIVLLTDGEPTANGSAGLVKTMTGKSTCANNGDRACGPELAEFLSTQDQSTGTGGVNGKQVVKTHTIAFNLNDSSGFLNAISNAGDGDSSKTTNAYTAGTASELQAVFEQITGEIMKSVDTTFVSPGVSVNTFNRLTHRNEIYFALFRPQSTASWPGNLKRFKLNSAGDILDQHDNKAINETTGFFKDTSEPTETGGYTSQSFWSAAADGNKVDKGGAASKLPNSASRKVYTHHSGSGSNVLTNGSNLFVDTNSAITKNMLGIGSESDSYRNNLIKWARGLDPATSTERKRLADPLHSVPHLVTYGGTDTNPDITIYYGDNEGFLHAINASTGVEEFAFIPGELLPILDSLYKNSATNKHPYGLDGSITSWVYDENGDNQLTGANDRAYVYAGMRRGGRVYYALNVTDRSTPKVLWKIVGGSGDFNELGQSWSKPVKTKVNIGGTVKDVLIFGGGYDPAQDDVDTITADTMGRAIYMVDATTGARLWHAGPTGADLTNADMKYSIPANVRVLDTNGDGLADQMYVGDVGGQVWRFDIFNGNAAASLVTGGVIANLAGATTASARRFYHELDVSVIIENNRRKLALMIGSGYQAHPLAEQTTNRIYMIKQDDVTSAPADGPDGDSLPDYVKLTESDLYDATANLIGEGDTAQQATALAALSAAKGWYITLENQGEKVLSTPLSVAGESFITTYSPTRATDGCNPATGTSRLYRVKTLDATPTNNTDDNQSLTKTDRVEILKTIGLPPDPVRLRIQDEDGTQDILCVGTECFGIGGSRSLIKTYWYSED